MIVLDSCAELLRHAAINRKEAIREPSSLIMPVIAPLASVSQRMDLMLMMIVVVADHETFECGWRGSDLRIVRLSR